MEKRLLPEDLFGAPPAKPAPLKSKPQPKKTDNGKKQPKPERKSPVVAAVKLAPIAPPPVKKPLKKSAPRKVAAPVSAPRSKSKPPQKKSAPAKKVSTPVRATSAQTEPESDRKKMIEQFKHARKKETAAPSVGAPLAAPSSSQSSSSDADRKKMIEQFKRAREQAQSAHEEPESPPTPPLSKAAKAQKLDAFRKQVEKLIPKPQPGQKPHERCPSCDAPILETAHICPHCYASVIQCPYCGRKAGALDNPKMATEQRFNRILKQYTLFSPALPAMPLQPIMDCSQCKSRIIICESCHTALKHSARSCPSCGNEVRQSKLLINPITILETILRRPDALRGVQRLIEMLLSSAGK